MNLCRKWSGCKIHLFLLAPCHSDSLCTAGLSKHQPTEALQMWVEGGQQGSRLQASLQPSPSQSSQLRGAGVEGRITFCCHHLLWASKGALHLHNGDAFIREQDTDVSSALRGHLQQSFEHQETNLKIPHILLNISQTLKWNKQSDVYLNPGDCQYQ